MQLKNKENNKKICHFSSYNFKNINCYVMSEVLLIKFYFALFDDRLTSLFYFENVIYLVFYIQTLHIYFSFIWYIGRSNWVRDGCSAIIVVKHVKTAFIQVLSQLVHRAVRMHNSLLLCCESSR